MNNLNEARRQAEVSCNRLFYSLSSLFDIMNEDVRTSELVRTSKESICIKIHKNQFSFGNGGFTACPNVIKSEKDFIFLNNLIRGKIIDYSLACTWASYNYYEFAVLDEIIRVNSPPCDLPQNSGSCQANKLVGKTKNKNKHRKKNEKSSPSTLRRKQTSGLLLV